jgi:hypothetical protein
MGSGTVLLSCKNREHWSLPNVYFLHRLTANIISVSQLDEGEHQVLVDGIMHIRDEDRRLLIRILRGLGRLYVLDATIARPVCLVARSDEDAWIWHARFGHINFAALRKMAREELVRGLPLLSQVEQLCEACLAGKHRRTPFPQKAQARSTEPLQLLHGDLCGPITPATLSGNWYFLLLVDYYSLYMWVCLLASKDEAVAAIKRVLVAAERKTGKKLLALRTDCGGEFSTVHFVEYCAQLRMPCELTAPHPTTKQGRGRL